MASRPRGRRRCSRRGGAAAPRLGYVGDRGVLGRGQSRLGVFLNWYNSVDQHFGTSCSSQLLRATRPVGFRCFSAVSTPNSVRSIPFQCLGTSGRHHRDVMDMRRSSWLVWSVGVFAYLVRCCSAPVRGRGAGRHGALPHAPAVLSTFVCCSCSSMPVYRFRSVCCSTGSGPAGLIVVGALTMATGQFVLALATSLPGGLFGQGAGRRRRRAHVHQRAPDARAWFRRAGCR